MELPDLGEHCSLSECRRLDYLPVKCTACKQIFCGDHFRFEAHQCPNENSDATECQQKQPVTVICPLCNRAVPLQANESPDFKINEHINRNCFIEENEKLFTNRCSVVSCKKKELMPLTCDRCRLNHCLTHRHPTDHQCSGQIKKTEQPRAVPLRAITSNFGRSFQGDLTEEEALRVAIQRSKQDETKAHKKSSKSLTKSCKLN